MTHKWTKVKEEDMIRLESPTGKGRCGLKPINKEDMIKLERIDVKRVTCRCNVKIANRISTDKFRTRYLLNSIRECLQYRIFGHAVSIDGSAWSSK